MWSWWKKKTAKPEAEKAEEKEVSVLQRVCGADAALYGFASNYLCVDPSTTISSKPLDVLIEEGEKSGDFRPALDKAIFEGAQHPDEAGKYLESIRDIAAKTITATEKEKAEIEKQGLADRAAFLGKRIEAQQLIQKRAEDILDVAAKYYNERLLELKEDERKAERIAEIREAEGQEMREELAERTEREAKKRERKGMGRAERKEAELQEQKDDLAAEERKKTREEERREAELQEQRTEEREKVERDARKNDLGGH